MTGFKCKVTGATSAVPVSTPQLARRCGADPTNGRTEATPSNCTYGAKQPFYWYQAEGSTVRRALLPPAPVLSSLIRLLVLRGHVLAPALHRPVQLRRRRAGRHIRERGRGVAHRRTRALQALVRPRLHSARDPRRDATLIPRQAKPDRPLPSRARQRAPRRAAHGRPPSAPRVGRAPPHPERRQLDPPHPPPPHAVYTVTYAAPARRTTYMPSSMSSVFPLLSVSSSSSLLSPPLLSLSCLLVPRPIPNTKKPRPVYPTRAALRLASPRLSVSLRLSPSRLTPPSPAPPHGARPCANRTPPRARARARC